MKFLKKAICFSLLGLIACDSGDTSVLVNDILVFENGEQIEPVLEATQTQSNEYPYLITNRSEAILVKVDSENNLSGALYYTDEATVYVEMDAEGTPSRAYIEDHIIIFDNYTGNTIDFGILTPQNTIEIFKDIDVSSIAGKGNFAFDSKKNSDAAQAIQVATFAVGLTTCAISLGLAIPTGGISLPSALAGCGSTLISGISLVTENEIVEALDTGITLLGFTDCLGKEIVGCTTFIAGVAAIVLEKLEEKSAISEEEIEGINELLFEQKCSLLALLESGWVLTTKERTCNPPGIPNVIQWDISFTTDGNFILSNPSFPEAGIGFGDTKIYTLEKDDLTLQWSFNEQDDNGENTIPVVITFNLKCLGSGLFDGTLTQTESGAVTCRGDAAVIKI